ncbi:MAG: hypothetical protein H7318_10880 [Oligoflexus sp.]|nr:hypothetical protein [Oligoflexus sp.]
MTFSKSLLPLILLLFTANACKNDKTVETKAAAKNNVVAEQSKTSSNGDSTPEVTTAEKGNAQNNESAEKISIYPGAGVWVFEDVAQDCSNGFPAFSIEGDTINPLDIYCDNKKLDLTKYLLGYEVAPKILDFFAKQSFTLERISNDKFKWVSNSLIYDHPMIRISTNPLKKPIFLPAVTPRDGLYMRPFVDLKKLDCPKSPIFSVTAVKDGKFGTATFQCKDQAPLFLSAMNPIDFTANFKTLEQMRDNNRVIRPSQSKDNFREQNHFRQLV